MYRVLPTHKVHMLFLYHQDHNDSHIVPILFEEVAESMRQTKRCGMYVCMFMFHIIIPYLTVPDCVIFYQQSAIPWQHTVQVTDCYQL